MHKHMCMSDANLKVATYHIEPEFNCSVPASLPNATIFDLDGNVVMQFDSTSAIIPELSTQTTILPDQTLQLVCGDGYLVDDPLSNILVCDGATGVLKTSRRCIRKTKLYNCTT